MRTLVAMLHGAVKGPGFARLAVADIDLLEDGGDDKGPPETPRREGEQASRADAAAGQRRQCEA